MDIVILKLKYPNDPTGRLVPHQHFVGELSEDKLDLYSVSSILGKEQRVFGVNRDDYEQIINQDMVENGFSVPSFIDCTKMYRIALDSSVNIKLLSNRNIHSELAERIRSRIARKKREGKHKIYEISVDELKKWNNKVIV